MTTIVTLSCPNCGGKLEITPDTDRFACPYCATEHIVERGGDNVFLKPVMEEIETVKASVDRSALVDDQIADELALKRIERERQKIQTWSETRIKEIVTSRKAMGNNKTIGIVLLLVFGGLSGFFFGSIPFAILSSIFNSDPNTGSLSGQATCLGLSLLVALFGAVLVYTGWQQTRKLDEQERTVWTKLSDIQHQEATVRQRLQEFSRQKYR